MMQNTTNENNDFGLLNPELKEEVGYLYEDHVDQSSNIARDCKSILSHVPIDNCEVIPEIGDVKVSREMGQVDILYEYIQTLKNFERKTKVTPVNIAFDIATVRSEFPIPSFSIIKTFLKDACLNQNWISAEKLFKKNKKDELILHPSCISTWKILVDIIHSIIMFGYVETYVKLRKRLLSTFIQWCRLLIQLDFNFIKLGKYKLAAFAAYAKGSDIYPPTPFNEQTLKDHAFAKPKFVFDKQFQNWFVKIRDKTDFESRFYLMSLVDTICRGVKKGADRPDKLMAHKSNLATFALFTTKKPIQPEKIIKNERLGTEFVMNPEIMENEIIRSVDEILVRCPEYVPKYSHFPSLSACVENKVSFGGSMAVVKQTVPQYPREIEVKTKFGLLKEPMSVLHQNHTGEDNPIVRKPLINTIDHIEIDTIKQNGEMKSVQYLEVTHNYDKLGTDLEISDYIDECLRIGSSMKLVGLLEAFKVRGISTSNAMESWILKPLQKFLSRQLLKHKVFAVTGTPLTAEHLLERIHVITATQKICSGDYDNATNELIARYTEVCIKRICQVLGLPENLTQLAVNSLVNNTVLYTYMNDEKHQTCVKSTGGFVSRGDYKKVVTEVGTQVEAQPMGKVLSFVVLCILNFAGCRKALEIDYGCVMPIADFPGLINGDDCCFPLTEFKIWEEVLATIGLKNSVGKTFFSNRFIEMNSRSFIVCENEDSFSTQRGDLMNPFLKEIPFINFGLIKGLLRSQCGAATGTISKIATLGACHQEMVVGLDFAYEDLDYLFRGYNSHYLESDILSGIPFYIPQWLAGLGLNPGPRYMDKIPEAHLRAASVIYQAYEDRRPKSLSLLKSCLMDDEVAKKQKALARIYKVDLVEVPFTVLEHENGLDNTLLLRENQDVYCDMVEMLWRNLPTHKIKYDLKTTDPCDKRLPDVYVNELDIEASCANHLGDFDETDVFLKAQQQILKKNIKFNGKLWRDAHGKISNTEVKPIPWFKLWHQKQQGYLPIVSMCSVRDQRETNCLLQ